MVKRLRYLLADLRHWLSAHRRAAGAFVLLLAAGGAAAVALLAGGDDDAGESGSPAPPVIAREAEPGFEADSRELETTDLGFPAFATKNTTRVAGPDPIADAAAVALAVHPSTGGVPGPAAVSIVDSEDWRAGIAAAALVGAPVGAPILISEDGELGPLAEGALSSLDPEGSAASGGEQVFSFGEGAAPDDLDVARIEGANAAEVAADAERLRRELAGRPEHVVIASADEPAYAMPAAGWAARSGDPVLFAQRDSLPAATRAALERLRGTPVYVLGPEAAISKGAFEEIEKLAPSAKRIDGESPTESSIAFARYVDGSFGWNINDPGHGFVIASAERPLDAAAAAPLSASGSWGPLLVTEEAGSPSSQLRGYLLDLKPGYVDDPTRAVTNHVWLIGDTDAISVGFGAQVDELAELAPVSSGVEAPG